MLKQVKRHKKLLILLGLLLLSGALVWAAAKLSGQANALAQDSGGYSADMESLTLASIKKPAQTKETPGTPPPCDWKKESKIRKALEANDAKYKQARAKAKSELRGSGQVAPATKDAIMKLAAEFKKLSDDYATMWSACNCPTRAKTARATGNSRLKSAAVLGSSAIDKNLILAMDQAQEQLQLATDEYGKKAVAGGEIAPADQVDLKNNVAPMAAKLVEDAKGLSGKVQALLMDIQANPKGGGSSGGGDRGRLSPIMLMTPQTRLLYANTRQLGGSARAFVVRVVFLYQYLLFLAGGPPPTMGFFGAPLCFVGSTAQP